MESVGQEISHYKQQLYQWVSCHTQLCPLKKHKLKSTQLNSSEATTRRALAINSVRIQDDSLHFSAGGEWRMASGSVKTLG